MIMYVTAMVDTCHTFVREDMTPRMNPNINSGLWVIMTCQYGFVNRNKCPTLVWDADSVSALFTQFFCDPKTLKNEVYLLIIKINRAHKCTLNPGSILSHFLWTIFSPGLGHTLLSLYAVILLKIRHWMSTNK